MKGSDRADRLVDRVTCTNSSLLRRSEVLRSFRRYLRAQSQGHYTIDRLGERDVEKGSTRKSFMKGRKRASVNQTEHWNCFKGDSGETAVYMGFSECLDTILN